MTTTPFTLPVPGGSITFGPTGLTFVPGSTASTSGMPITFPTTLPQQLNLPGLAQGTPPDLSALLPVLTPIISAAVPGIAPFLPIIGAVLHILYTLVTQVNAANASGTPNPVLQNVHDAAWDQVLKAFGQKPATATAVG